MFGREVTTAGSRTPDFRIIPPNHHLLSQYFTLKWEVMPETIPQSYMDKIFFLKAHNTVTNIEQFSVALNSFNILLHTEETKSIFITEVEIEIRITESFARRNP